MSCCWTPGRVAGGVGDMVGEFIDRTVKRVHTEISDSLLSEFKIVHFCYFQNTSPFVSMSMKSAQ